MPAALHHTASLNMQQHSTQTRREKHNVCEHKNNNKNNKNNKNNNNNNKNNNSSEPLSPSCFGMLCTCFILCCFSLLPWWIPIVHILYPFLCETYIKKKALVSLGSSTLDPRAFFFFGDPTNLACCLSTFFHTDRQTRKQKKHHERQS